MASSDSIESVLESLDGIPQSKIHPRYLHSNSTSHIWAFGAFAELIDNAYDPDVAATELYIDNEEINDQSCLVFLDNGNGMDKEKLLKMLSFGYCEKDAFNTGDHKPVGLYGNGFKTGSMRLGKDALVFTRRRGNACIGLLSQTYLQKIQADTVWVPILEYKLPSLIRMPSTTQNNLDAILRYSPFNTEANLKDQLKSFESSITGTKIIIYNLNRLLDDREELDFLSVPDDIRCPEAFARDTSNAEQRPTEYVPEYRQSLRPMMKIFIRKQVIKTKYIPKMLHLTKTIQYKPSLLKNEKKTIQIVLGFSCEKDSKQNYGFLMYHKNRLIKAYEKVGCQKLSNEKGVGVIGVVKLDFLKAVHNKQDFYQDQQYNTVINALATKLNAYWNEAMDSNDEMNNNQPDWDWVQCDRCLMWRRLITGTDPESLPEKWYCVMNEDAMYNRCFTEEEPDHKEIPEERKGKRSLGSSIAGLPPKSIIKTAKRKLSSSQPETTKNKRKSARLTSSQPESAKNSNKKALTIKLFTPKSKTQREKSNSKTIFSDNNTDDDDFDNSSLPTLPIRKSAKRRLKSAITTNITHFESQTDSTNSQEPRPGCSKDPDELVDDESDCSFSIEPIFKKAVKRQLKSTMKPNTTQSKCQSDSINSVEMSPKRKNSNEIVDDDFNSSIFKRPYQINSLSQSESSSDNLNTESQEVRESYSIKLNESLQIYVDEFDRFTLPSTSKKVATKKSVTNTKRLEQQALQSSETGDNETVESVSCAKCSKEKDNKDVQTEITYDENGLTEFHKQVFRLLQLIVPTNNSCKLINVEEDVDELIKLYLSKS